MKASFLIWFVLLAATVSAQEVPATTEQQLENLGDENPEDDALLQQLAFYQQHPLNLNTATAEDFYPLRLLTPVQVQNLIRYRDAFGAFISLYELQAVPGFDLLTIRRLLPFIFVGEVRDAKDVMAARFRGGSAALLFRISRVLETSKGYDTSAKTHYLGDPNHLLLRYTFQYKNLLYYGLTADKDAGEPFFRGAQKAGFDFYSVHFFLRNLGRFKAIAIGDYAVNLGQGLTQWQSLAFGKSGEVTAIKRQAPVLLPYRSAGEFYFSRGAAATVRLWILEATAFFSCKKFSGNLVHDTTEQFSSFGTSGYSRTAAELEDRNRITDLSFGGNVSYNRRRLNIGVNTVAHQFSLPLQKSNAPYNRFALSGRQVVLSSMDYSVTFQNVHLFGEAAVDQKLHTAVVQGLLLSVDPKMDLVLFYRAIQKAYQAPFANAFTENTLPGNETGLYTGLQIKPAAGWQLSMYADFYRFPFLKYRVSAPGAGADYLLQVNYAPDKNSEVYLRYRSETKPLDVAGNASVMPWPADQTRQSLRLHFTTRINRQFSLKGRTEAVWFAVDQTVENGFLMYVEAALLPAARWTANLRLQYFETGGYNSRIYAYESDVLYGVSIPGFFDQGFRYYLNVSHAFKKRLSFWVRAAQTLYTNADSIGSGLDEIAGHTKTQVTVQLRYSFGQK